MLKVDFLKEIMFYLRLDRWGDMGQAGKVGKSILVKKQKTKKLHQYSKILIRENLTKIKPSCLDSWSLRVQKEAKEMSRG